MKVRRFIEGMVDGVGGVFNSTFGVKAAARFSWVFRGRSDAGEGEAGANEAEALVDGNTTRS
jgi:hypothetical protein